MSKKEKHLKQQKRPELNSYRNKKKTEDQLDQGQPNLKQKEEESKNGKKMHKETATDEEAIGMAIIYNNNLEKHVTDLNQHDGRNITIALKMQNGNIPFTGAHAPHAGSKEAKYKDK